MAKPETGPDGSVNMMVWQCIVPGKPGVSPFSFYWFFRPENCRLIGQGFFFFF